MPWQNSKSLGTKKTNTCRRPAGRLLDRVQVSQGLQSQRACLRLVVLLVDQP